jgi:RNA polymerase sigma-70 factor (ECF subfamily)
MSEAPTRPTFDEVLRDHGAMIRRIAAAHEADAAARQDLVQDILYALWRALPRWRGEGPLRAFVARVAANRAVSHVQRALKRPPVEALPETLVAAGASPESEAIARDQAERLAAAVRSLPLGLRETAVMALEGLGHAEIAAVLGVTPNAVAVRMTRAKAELRRRLEDDHAE